MLLWKIHFTCTIEEAFCVSKYTLNLLILIGLVQVGPKKQLTTFNHCESWQVYVYLLNCGILLQECVGTKATAKHSNWRDRRGNWKMKYL